MVTFEELLKYLNLDELKKCKVSECSVYNGRLTIELIVEEEES